MARSAPYRITFLNHNQVYELYCDGVTSSGLWGFIEVSGLKLGDPDAVVIDPTEERLRDEFGDVDVLHVPMHSVLRVEQVKKVGQARIRDRESGEKVTPFPLSPPKAKG